MSRKIRRTPLATTKTAALARVLDLVPKGYTRYTAGCCPPAKLLRLAQKFHARYAVAATPAERLTRRTKGLANALLVLYWPIEPPHLMMTNTLPAKWLESYPDGMLTAPPVEWLLLVTEGAGAVTAEERLRSVLEKPRLAWLGYELVRHTARGKAAWTWCRGRTEMAEWVALLGHQLARRQAAAVGETLLRASHQPGFAGVRAQSRALIDLARQRGYTGEVPFLFHVQKVAAGLMLLLPEAMD